MLLVHPYTEKTEGGRPRYCYYGGMQIHDLDAFLENQIDDYLLKDVQTVKDRVPVNIHPGNAAYLMIGAVCSGIDFIGSLVTEQTLIPGCEVCGKPEQIRNDFPFEHYCQDYLAKVDGRYATLGPLIRELVRNGISHSFATKGKIGITRVGNREASHLTYNKDIGLFVINADCFFDDFKMSYEQYALLDVSDGGSKREQALKNYVQMRDSYSKHIERTMSDLKDKLDKWEWEFKGPVSTVPL
jgi:hypothetical protein